MCEHQLENGKIGILSLLGSFRLKVRDTSGDQKMRLYPEMPEVVASPAHSSPGSPGSGLLIEKSPLASNLADRCCVVNFISPHGEE